MSRVFEAYAEEFSSLSATAGRHIGTIRDQSGDARQATRKEAEETLQKADELVQQMELEAKSAPREQARDLTARAKASKSEVSVLRANLRQAVASVPARSELLGGSSGDEGNDDQRARLLRMGERLQDGTSKLQAAHRTVLETEAIGANILGDLRSQRETIMHSTGTLQRANEGLARSKRTLAAISRRALGNRVIMWVMIVLLSTAVLFLLYVQMFGLNFGGGDDTTPTPPRRANATSKGGLRLSR